MKDELTAAINTLNQLEQSASFAQKYGPYYFAVALLIVAPFVCRAIFSSAFNSTNEAARAAAYADFRLYLRTVLLLGSLCIVAGVGWWLFENYRENNRTLAAVEELKTKLAKVDSTVHNMTYAIAGVILDGLNPQDVLNLTIQNSDMSVVFAKLPQSAAWYFVVMSDKELPQTLDISVAYSQFNEDPTKPPILRLIPVRLQFGKKFGNYKFSFNNSTGVLQPM
jgi:hypothetical protein